MGITNLDRLELGGVEIIPPITEKVTKTVAADGDQEGVYDFDAFAEALSWASQQKTEGYLGKVELSLEDGLHFYTDDPVYIDGTVDIVSASGNKADCKLTKNGVDNPYYMLLCERGAHFTLKEVTLDPTIDGATGSRGIAVEGGTCILWDCTISNFTSKAVNVSNEWTTFLMLGGEFTNNDIALSIYKRAKIDISGTVVFNLNGTAIDSVAADIRVLSSMTITNSTTQGVNASGGSIVNLGSGSSLTLTGNTADANIPLNEIQYDGTHVIDGTAALSFKA